MKNVEVKEVLGEEAKLAIDEFYSKNGSQGRARNNDLFFIAHSRERIVGCVRFCVEEGTPMLRTMYVDSTYRGQGIGRMLLQAFENHLEKNKIKNVFCLPYVHLEKFYGSIGFKIVQSSEVPQFLIERSAVYANKETKTLFMRRS